MGQNPEITGTNICTDSVMLGECFPAFPGGLGEVGGHLVGQDLIVGDVYPELPQTISERTNGGDVDLQQHPGSNNLLSSLSCVCGILGFH